MYGSRHKAPGLERFPDLTITPVHKGFSGIDHLAQIDATGVNEHIEKIMLICEGKRSEALQPWFRQKLFHMSPAQGYPLTMGEERGEDTRRGQKLLAIKMLRAGSADIEVHHRAVLAQG